MDPLNKVNLFSQTTIPQGVNTPKAAAIGGGSVGGSAAGSSSLLASNTSGLSGLKTDQSVFTAGSMGIQPGLAGSKLHLIG